MKLRVRIHRQTSQVELPGGEPRVRDLKDHIKEEVLSCHGLGSDTDFSLSLNGSELLSDSDQTLSSCGIVSGDLICVVLPQSDQTSVTPAVTSGRPSSSSRSAAVPEPESASMDSQPSVPKWEPMLCSEAEEGQAPLTLELSYRAAQATSPSDAIMVAGNVLMLETGFIPQGEEPKPSGMPAGWRSAGGAYRLQFTHPLCENSRVTVVGVCMGPLLVIDAILKVKDSVDTVGKLRLSPSSYVTHEWPGGSAAAAFKDLRKLSRIFKDQLVYPLIAAARAAMELPVAFGLTTLPPELLLKVLRLLDVGAVGRLSSVCRHLHVSTADSTLWRFLYQRDFPRFPRSGDADWKEIYKRAFIRSRERRHVPSGCFFPGQRRHPVPFPHFPPVPGIIGGEYDQRQTFPYRPMGPLPGPRYDPISPHPLLGSKPRPADVRRGFI